MNRKGRRAQGDSETIGKSLFNPAFLQLLDSTAKITGTSRAKIEEIVKTGNVTIDDYKQIAECLILMTGLVLEL